MKSRVGEAKRLLRGGKESSESSLLLGSGSSLVNLACSGDVSGAFRAGHYYFVVGDSMSGKTWLGMSCFAEAANDPRFDDYRLIYDPTEYGALMDMEKFFGDRAAKRIEVQEPASSTVEDFYFQTWRDLDEGVPFVKVLDSQDSLSSFAEGEKFDESMEARRKGKSTAGSYGDGKAKVHSANIRKLMRPLRESGSILIVLNQTRDSFDPFKPKSYSGGRALLFYATLQLWNSVKGHVRKTIRGKDRELGVVVKVVVKKNRETGRQRGVLVPILHSVGIDELGSMVDYLVDEKIWKKPPRGSKIEATGLGPTIELNREDLIARIEEDDLVEDVRMLVQRTWNDVEAACEVKRKRRYQ